MARSWAVWAIAVLSAALVFSCGGKGRSPGQTRATEESGAGGEGGEGGVVPNVYVDQIRQERVSEIDLLFVIDNSAGMADKQRLLAQAIPLLMTRLITPVCVDDDGEPIGANADERGRCAIGQPEFTPQSNIHVGVISSSLGSHGSANPSDVCVTTSEDDHAQLLGKIRLPERSWNGQGFLVWDPGEAHTPAGDANAGEFTDKVAATIESANEVGCRYPATLEAWYRFLIDPEPPRAIVVQEAGASPFAKASMNKCWRSAPPFCAPIRWSRS